MHGSQNGSLSMARAYALSIRQLCDARAELYAARQALVAIALCADSERGREMAVDFVAGLPAVDVAGMLPAEMIDRLERLSELEA